MALPPWRVEQTIRDRWRNVVAGLQQINPRSVVRPSQAADIIRLSLPSPPGQVKLVIAPVVLNLPERANSNATNLYVVLKGWLSFSPAASSQDPLQTKDFGTQVAYFRHKGSQLYHVFGAHFDLDTGVVGHPVCHAQIASQLGFSQHVCNRFNLADSLVDSVIGVMRTVRIPTAQMDIFSVLRQICADHLVGDDPAPLVLNRFRAIATDCDIAGPVRPYVRSLDWYH